MKELIQHLEALNAEKLAWLAEDPENRWTGLYITDEEHWLERGISTVEEFELEEMRATIYDLYKEVHGFRNRHTDWWSMSMEELKEEYDYLIRALEAEATAQEERERRALEEFEGILTDMRRNHKIDTRTALRWLMQAEDVQGQYDIDHFFWRYGLGREARMFYNDVYRGAL